MHPDLAIRLDPGNPLALLTLAERARAEYLELQGVGGDVAPSAENTDSEVGASSSATAALAPANRDPAVAARIRSLRDSIADLARRALVNDPLNARAFRMLGEVAETPEQTRLMMQEAVKRSRRESIAVFWLMADSYGRGDFAGVVQKADILLKSQPQIASEVMRYLGAASADAGARSILVKTLAKRPDWRGGFFNALPQNVRYAGTPLELMTGLKSAGSPPSPSELAPYLDVLIGAGMVSYARDVWLQLMHDGEQQSLLVNANFAQDPSGLPFDWSVRRATNATFEFLPSGGGNEGRSARIDFGTGRVQFPDLSQVVVLAPGRYRLEGEFRGLIRGRRGLRWEIRCWRGKQLAETEMLFASRDRAWQGFNLHVDVPDREDCRSQQVRLFHDARSASEQLVSGQISFRSLVLSRLDR